MKYLMKSKLIPPVGSMQWSSSPVFFSSRGITLKRPQPNNLFFSLP